MALPVGILCVLALAALGMGFFALFCARALASDVGRRVSDIESRVQSALQGVEARLAEWAAEARDRHLQPAVTVLPARLRPGMNLTTRSQVLRLHRHGETADNIARVLEVPRQEVDLLLKVHGIVIKGI
jgi:DNA-binding NarL/FixJ family response regulator